MIRKNDWKLMNHVEKMVVDTAGDQKIPQKMQKMALEEREIGIKLQVFLILKKILMLFPMPRKAEGHHNPVSL